MQRLGFKSSKWVLTEGLSIQTLDNAMKSKIQLSVSEDTTVSDKSFVQFDA